MKFLYILPLFVALVYAAPPASKNGRQSAKAGEQSLEKAAELLAEALKGDQNDGKANKDDDQKGLVAYDTHGGRPTYGRPISESNGYGQQSGYGSQQQSQGYGGSNQGYGESKPTYGQPSQGYGESKPTYQQPSQGYGESKPTYGESKPTYGESKPTYQQPSQSYGESKPTYGESKPTYNQPQPSYGESKPTYGQQPQPSYGESKPTYGQQPQPSYGQSKPTYNQPQPSYGQSKPTYGQQPQPSYGGSKPTYGQPSPGVGIVNQQVLVHQQPHNCKNTNLLWRIREKVINALNFARSACANVENLSEIKQLVSVALHQGCSSSGGRRPYGQSHGGYKSEAKSGSIAEKLTKEQESQVGAKSEIQLKRSKKSSKN